MTTYTITETQLVALESAMTLAKYFVDDHDGINIEQAMSDRQTYDQAMRVFKCIELQKIAAYINDAINNPEIDEGLASAEKALAVVSSLIDDALKQGE
jgi:hypothetical protein